MHAKWRQTLLRSFLHVMAWVSAYILTTLIFKESPSRQAYGFLAGWWCALYIDNILNLSFEAAIIPFLVYLFIGVLAVYFTFPWIYHDVPSDVSFPYLVMLFAGAGIFVSPVLVNIIMRLLLNKVKSKRTPGR
jgi:hypothetical protein